MIYVQQHAGYKFSEWLISAILSPFPLPEHKSCLFSMLGDQQSAFSLFFTLKLLVTTIRNMQIRFLPKVLVRI